MSTSLIIGKLSLLAFIIGVVLFATVCCILGCNKNKNQNTSQDKRKSKIRSFLTALSIFLILAGSFFLVSSSIIPFKNDDICPTCNIKCYTNYCTECGTEVIKRIDMPKNICLKCDKTITSNYCPDCGNKATLDQIN